MLDSGLKVKKPSGTELEEPGPGWARASESGILGFWLARTGLVLVLLVCEQLFEILCAEHIWSVHENFVHEKRYI